MNITTYKTNSTKVQNPRRKMQVALLAEPKTPPGVERVYIIILCALAMKCGGFFVHTMKHCYATALYYIYTASAIRYTCAYKFTARVQSRA